jgi:hypothetical protein
MRHLFALGCLFAWGSVSVAADPPKPTSEQIEFFEKKVRPILSEHCYSCHGPKKQNAGLRLDSAAGLKQGTDSGPIVVAGDPAKSRLISSVKRQGEFPMPPKLPLPPEAVAALTEWVKAGAVFPEAATSTGAIDPKKHWAFQPVKDPIIPKGPAHPVDALVRAKMSDKELSLSPEADRRTLIRRAYYDLIGLPPTAAEIEAFVNDKSPDAWEKVIDRLLASPQYGERWARYWLDIARYADTKGYVFQEDRNFPYAYTYRDYVIRSFNDDKPYNQFIVEQLAADRLPLGEDKSALAAMGFLTLNRRFLNNTHDIIDDRIDVTTRGLLGLTVTCARCHDHKYDPIPAKDYYSLYGVFASSIEPKDLPLIGEVKRTPEVIAFEKELASREADLDAFIAKKHGDALARLRTVDSIADHIRGSFDLGNNPADQIQAFARERDLNAYVLGRWKTFLGEQLKSHSPIFSSLAALHAVPESEFEKKASQILAALGKDEKKPVNPLVLKALTDAKPKAFKDASNAIGRLIVDRASFRGPLRNQESELAAILGANGPLDVALADFDKIQNRADREAVTAQKKKIDAFKATSPAAPPRAMVLNDGPAFQPYVFLRGNANNHGPTVPRQFVEIAAGPDRKPFANGSGRLEMAKAIASAENPLTARVMANRVWLYHFGHGLVRTPSDFGVRSDPPTHPELLDWLAKRFVEDGWSVKKLHKRIMMSETYRQASTVSVEIYKTDPENRMLSHQNRKRLDFEALRDSMLVVSGKLDTTQFGKSVDLFKTPFTGRRTVYGAIDRTNMPGTMRAFDVASPDQHSPQRFQTTVPQQALFLMNSPFVSEMAKALVSRTEFESATTTDEKIAALYLLTLGRKPTKEELQIGREFIDAAGTAKSAFSPWVQYAQVLLLSNEFAFVD